MLSLFLGATSTVNSEVNCKLLSRDQCVQYSTELCCAYDTMSGCHHVDIPGCGKYRGEHVKWTPNLIAALPDRRSQIVPTRGMSASLFDPPCKTSADCAGKAMTKPECVEQSTGDWAQCVDCDAKAFQAACRYWTPALLAPAEKACALNCTGTAPPTPPAPKTLACSTDADCTDPSKPSCVVQSDKQYAQCISCDDDPFQSACPYWEQIKFLPAAEAKCGKQCTGKGPPPKLACHTDADCSDPAEPTCVVQPDGFYAQCVTCDHDQFELDCKEWERAKFLPAAEAKCNEKCQI